MNISQEKWWMLIGLVCLSIVMVLLVTLSGCKLSKVEKVAEDVVEMETGIDVEKIEKDVESVD